MSSEKIAVVAGSFDPVTVGHLDIIKRAANIFDKIIVGVLDNSEKSYLFDKNARLALMKEAVLDIPNAKAYYYDGLLIDFVKMHNASVIVKGIRNERDLAFEKKMAEYNYKNGGIETLFFFANDEYANVSSTLVRDLLKKGENVAPLLPEKAYIKLKSLVLE